MSFLGCQLASLMLRRSGQTEPGIQEPWIPAVPAGRQDHVSSNTTIDQYNNDFVSYITQGTYYISSPPGRRGTRCVVDGPGTVLYLGKKGGNPPGFGAVVMAGSKGRRWDLIAVKTL